MHKSVAIRVGTERIKREDGYMYFVKDDGMVWRAPKSCLTPGGQERVGHEAITILPGFIYILDRLGYVAAVPSDRETLTDAQYERRLSLARSQKLLRSKGLDIAIRELVTKPPSDPMGYLTPEA